MKSSGVLFGLFFALALVAGTAMWARPSDQRTLFIVVGAVVVANVATALALNAGARAELRAREAENAALRDGGTAPTT